MSVPLEAFRVDIRLDIATTGRLQIERVVRDVEVKDVGLTAPHNEIGAFLASDSKRPRQQRDLSAMWFTPRDSRLRTRRVRFRRESNIPMISQVFSLTRRYSAPARRTRTELPDSVDSAPNAANLLVVLPFCLPSAVTGRVFAQRFSLTSAPSVAGSPSAITRRTLVELPIPALFPSVGGRP